jgi:hypothetical protein
MAARTRFFKSQVGEVCRVYLTTHHSALSIQPQTLLSQMPSSVFAVAGCKLPHLQDSLAGHPIPIFIANARVSMNTVWHICLINKSLPTC